MTDDAVRLSHGGRLLAAIAVVSVAVLGPQASTCTHDLSGAPLADALVALGSLVQLALSGWVVLVVALSWLARSSRVAGAATRVLAPAALRRLVFVGAAGAVGVITIGPVHAEPVSAPRDPVPHAAPRPAPHSLDGLRLPDRPSSPPAESTRVATPSSSDAGHATDLVVRPGDTLWGIAAHALGPAATDAEVARATVRWHAANRAVIGADPDLIVPGQHLTRPDAKDQP